MAITEGKDVGGRSWGKGLQSIALAHNAVSGEGLPTFTKPMEDEAFAALHGDADARLLGILRRFRDGDITKGQFESQAKTVLRDSYQKTYSLGAHRMGAPAGMALDKQDLAWLKGARYDEFDYLGKFADALEDDSWEMEPEDRIGLYSDSMESVYWAGQVSTTPDNALIYWNMSDAEHCQDCLELAAGSPYTRKELPTTPRSGGTSCICFCRCFLTLEYDEEPAMDEPEFKPWKPMREWDGTRPPPGTRPAQGDERGFIENMGLRIQWERTLAQTGQGAEHNNLALGLASALAGFLAAKSIWAPPTWLADDDSLLTGEDFDTAFEEDSFEGGDLAELSDEDFDALLAAWEQGIPQEVTSPKAQKAIKKAVQQAGGKQFEDKTRQAMKMLLEMNPWHDRIGRFAHAPSTDGGGAYGGTTQEKPPTYRGIQPGFGKVPTYRMFDLHQDIVDAEGVVRHSGGSTVSDRTLQQYGIPLPAGTPEAPNTFPRGAGKVFGKEYAHGHEVDVEIPEGKQLSVLHDPESGHLGWMEGLSAHSDAEEAMDIRGADKEKYVHVGVIGDPAGDYRKSFGLTVTSSGNTAADRVREGRMVNQTFAMLRRKGFPSETPIRWAQWNGTMRELTLNDKAVVEQKALVGTIAGEILQELAAKDETVSL